MAEKDFAWKNLLANMRSACQVLNPTLVSFMKAKISEIEKATVSLNDFVLNRRPVFFFYELYNRNHIRFSQDFKEIISGLINFILKHPGDFKFSELKSEELELIRFVPGQLTEPIILGNDMQSEVDCKDLDALANLIEAIQTNICFVEMEKKYNPSLIDLDFIKTIRGVRAEEIQKGSSSIEVRKIIGHIAMKNYQEMIKFIKDIHEKMIVDSEFNKRFLDNYEKCFEKFDFEEDIPKGGIFENVYKNSKFKFKYIEGKRNNAKNFCFYSCHVFEHGKKKEKKKYEETNGGENKNETEKQNNEIWYPMDLEFMYYAIFTKQLRQMNSALKASTVFDNIPIPALQVSW